MCLVVPLKSVKRTRRGWVMEDGRVVKTDLVGKIDKGDYLVCQQDMAVQRLSKKEALAMRRALKGVNDELQKRH